MIPGEGPEHRRQQTVESLRVLGIPADLTREYEYKDRYRVFRGPDSAVIDIHYDKAQRITGVESGSASGSTDLVLAVIECIEQLPIEFLRPRFAERGSSPTRLVKEHRQALTEADLDIAGVRLGQYQLLYDIEDAANPSVPPGHLVLAYDRKGAITWGRRDESPVSERAARAIGVAHLVATRPPSEGEA